MNKLTNTIGMSQQEKEKFPAQPQENLKGQHAIEISSITSNKEQLKSITTFRSGKEFNKGTPLNLL